MVRRWLSTETFLKSSSMGWDPDDNYRIAHIETACDKAHQRIQESRVVLMSLDQMFTRSELAPKNRILSII